MITLDSGCLVAEDMDDAMLAIRRLRDPDTKLLVFDCETKGLNYHDSIVGHVLTFGPAPRDTIYIPVRHGQEPKGNVHPHQGVLGHPFEECLHQELSSRRGLHVVGHNLMFDLMRLWYHGISVVGTVEDTQVNAALLNEHARKFSLSACCTAAGVQEKKGEALYDYLAYRFGGDPGSNQMGNFWKVAGSDPVATDYATGDGVSTWQLVHVQWKLLASESREQHDQRARELGARDLLYIHGIEKGVTRVLYRMKKRGVKIDVPELDRIAEYAENRVTEGRKLLPDGFNERGPAQIRALMEKHGHTDWPTTLPSPRFPYGQASFKEEWLKTNEIGRAIVAVRKWTHLQNSFITPLYQRHMRDGRVYPTYWQMASDDFGTITGRFSCSEPNLQQIPKRNKEMAKLFRKAFRPDEGLIWYDTDLSQAEPRILAHYARPQVLLRGYLSIPFVDAHQSVATAAGIDREDGKRLNQTIVTGGGLGRVTEMIGDRATEVWNAYHAAMPELKVFQRAAADRFRARGFVTSLLGRKARLVSSDQSYLAINRILQCSNADAMKKILVDIDRICEDDGDRCAILNSVHDAVSLQAPEDGSAQDTVDAALRAMTDFGPGRAIEMIVPMVADYGVGHDWAEATFPADKLQVGNL